MHTWYFKDNKWDQRKTNPGILNMALVQCINWQKIWKTAYPSQKTGPNSKSGNILVTFLLQRNWSKKEGQIWPEDGKEWRPDSNNTIVSLPQAEAGQPSLNLVLSTREEHCKIEVNIYARWMLPKDQGEVQHSIFSFLVGVHRPAIHHPIKSCCEKVAASSQWVLSPGHTAHHPSVTL